MVAIVSSGPLTCKCYHSRPCPQVGLRVVPVVLALRASWASAHGPLPLAKRGPHLAGAQQRRYRLYSPELLDVLKRIKYLRDVKLLNLPGIRQMLGKTATRHSAPTAPAPPILGENCVSSEKHAVSALRHDALARHTDSAQLPGRYIDLPKNDISPSQIRDARFLRLAREVDDETCSSRSDHLLANWPKHLDRRSTIANEAPGQRPGNHRTWQRRRRCAPTRRMACHARRPTARIRRHDPERSSQP